MRIGRLSRGLLGLALLVLIPGAVAAVAATKPEKGAEDYFIVSSIDAAHDRIVLKRPTEVTMTMHVTERTVYRDEQGKTLRFTDLRSGDTGYITFTRNAAGEATALRVRLGPMSVEELHRRYLTPGS